MRRILGLLPLLLLPACASAYVRSADADAAAIGEEKRRAVADFRERDLVRPAPAAPTGTAAVAAAGAAAPAMPKGKSIFVPPVVTLADAVRIATRHSRDYQSEREAIHLDALALGLVRRDFGGAPVFSGRATYLLSDSRRGEPSDSATAGIAASYFLPSGARLLLSTDVATSDASGDGVKRTASGAATVTISQPLLRGGPWVAFEPLTQAERTLMYAMRDFELFRQSFAIDVVERYYGLVNQKQRIGNARRSTEALDFIARRAAAFFNVDRLNKIEKLRADQAYLASKNRLIDEESAYKVALDRFKVFLGIPTDSEFDIPDDAAPEFVPVSLDLGSAVAAALHNRLDLLTARERLEDAQRRRGVQRNALLPDVGVTGAYGVVSEEGATPRRMDFDDDQYSVGVSVTLPLDRLAERNSYRAALIAVDRARRGLRAAEDAVAVEVRDGLRRLRQQEESIQIQREIIVTENARVRYAELQYQAGLIGTRDLTEARENLLAAENAVIQSVVSYESARLNLLRQLGLLFVSEEGEIVR